MKLYVLYNGFHGRLDFGSLGWGAVSVISTDRGPVLVDAGAPSQRNFFRERIKAIGYDFSDFKTILLTHAHWDHIYNIDLFPDAVIYISRKEIGFIKTQNALAVHPYFTKALLERDLIMFEDGQEILPGITAFLTPGHTPGSSVFIFTQDDNVKTVIAGDALKNRAEIVYGASQTFNKEESMASIKKILSLGNHILPGHDGWIDVEDGKPIARGGNDVVFIAPANMTINGEKELVMHIDY